MPTPGEVLGSSVSLAKMDVVFGESGSALAPASRKGYTHRVKDRSFSCVVGANEDSSFSKFDVERLYRPEILDVYGGDSH